MTSPSTPLHPGQDPRFEGALQLASRFVALLRSGRSYPVGHAGFTQQLENYLKLLAPVLNEHGRACFDAPEGDLCMNGEQLPFRQNVHRALEQLVQEFAARTLEGIEFTRGLTLPEFQAFMHLFLLGERWKGQELITACHDAGIVHLHALPLRSAAVDLGAVAAADSLPETLGASRHAWVTLFSGSQSLFMGQALDHGIELRHVKRIAQPLVDSVLAGHRIAAALSCVTPGETMWAHAAHTTLTAVSVGARLGLGRRDLSDIAVTALLHDAGHAWTKSGAPHTHEGVRRIAWSTTFNRNSLDAMRTAFEHHDGVDRLQPGSAPTLMSQLVAMADTYVTFLSRGTSRAEWLSPSNALARVLERVRVCGQLAMGVALVRALGFYPPGQLVELDDGSIARTLVPVADDPERPWVQWVADERGTMIRGGSRETTPLPEARRIAYALPRDQWPVDAARPAA